MNLNIRLAFDSLTVICDKPTHLKDITDINLEAITRNLIHDHLRSQSPIIGSSDVLETQACCDIKRLPNL